MSSVTTSLHLHKRALFRGAGFFLAAATLCAALVTGSILRDSRTMSDGATAVAEIERKDQARLGEPAQPSTARVAATGDREADIATGAVSPSPDWREEEFASVEIVDGRTFRAGAVTIRLADLELPHPDQVCRTLDNRLEQCVARAATQLELLTRSRKVACRYRMITSSEAVGECRIGANDLATRMIRTGYAQRRSNDAVGSAVASVRSEAR